MFKAKGEKMKKQFKKKMVERVLVRALALLISVYAVAPILQAGNACDRSLRRCGADAMVVLIFSGIQTSALYSTSCLIFYDWCRKYYL